MGKISTDIFSGGSDSDNEIKTENEYAKNYDAWRKKEELNKLITKYGKDAAEGIESSSSSDDDEDAAELTEEIEKDFLKTLSYLKTKDPKIYDNNVSFFRSTETPSKETKATKKPITLMDYERKLVLEKGGMLSDEEDHNNHREQPIEEENSKLKIDIEEDEDIMFELKLKTKQESANDYPKWLTGETEEIPDDETKSELKPLKAIWSDPNLDNEEKFLRDYVLKKRYLEKDREDYVASYDEIAHDSDKSLSGDEEQIARQEEFEHKYNFRFEEPDQDFIKRYPRTIEQSLRKTDDKRKLKRAETKDRKRKEKEEKMADLKKLQELKRKEIEEKIEKLKEVTGATDISFQNDDIDGDFDPEAHDQRMQALFSDEFYQGPESEQKPEFPDLDQELEIENWDRWDGPEHCEDDGIEKQPHCEDDSFNMDADYDPSASLKQQDPIENSKGRRKRGRKSKVAEALNRPKPKYDPNDKNYEKYFDEYYKLECEDIIGDVPCRFRYREVAPNDFGLSIEEILLAKEKELNRWCSLKKMVQRRPENIEKYEQIAYSRKANNTALKQRLLPSLFSDQADEDKVNETPSKANEDVPSNSLQNAENLTENGSVDERESTSKQDEEQSQTKAGSESKKDKKKNKKKKKAKPNEIAQNKTESDHKNKSQTTRERNKRKRPNADDDKRGGKKMKKGVNIEISDARLSAFGINPKKFKNKLIYGNKK